MKPRLGTQQIEKKLHNNTGRLDQGISTRHTTLTNYSTELHIGQLDWDINTRRAQLISNPPKCRGTAQTLLLFVGITTTTTPITAGSKSTSPTVLGTIGFKSLVIAGAITAGSRTVGDVHPSPPVRVWNRW